MGITVNVNLYNIVLYWVEYPVIGSIGYMVVKGSNGKGRGTLKFMVGLVNAGRPVSEHKMYPQPIGITRLY